MSQHYNQYVEQPASVSIPGTNLEWVCVRRQSQAYERSNDDLLASSSSNRICVRRPSSQTYERSNDDLLANSSSKGSIPERYAVNLSTFSPIKEPKNCSVNLMNFSPVKGYLNTSNLMELSPTKPIGSPVKSRIPVPKSLQGRLSNKYVVENLQPAKPQQSVYSYAQQGTYAEMPVKRRLFSATPEPIPVYVQPTGQVKGIAAEEPEFVLAEAMSSLVAHLADNLEAALSIKRKQFLAAVQEKCDKKLKITVGNYASKISRKV